MNVTNSVFVISELFSDMEGRVQNCSSMQQTYDKKLISVKKITQILIRFFFQSPDAKKHDLKVNYPVVLRSKLMEPLLLTLKMAFSCMNKVNHWSC